jgi:uncharacterized protein (DUF488 family)
MAASSEILTIGHSNHSFERFLELVFQAGVTAIADVRSAPVSRFAPHFNRDALETALDANGIAYGFFGRELGGRPKQPSLFTGGVADYEKMAATSSFRTGLERLIEEAEQYRIAVMCSEADPLDCHRCLLIAPALADRHVGVAHVLTSGEIISHAQVEARLLDLAGLAADDLFASREARLVQAYRARGRKVAFAESEAKPTDVMAQG